MAQEEFTKSNIFQFPAKVDYSSGGIVSKKVLKKDTGNISLFAFDAGEGLSEHTAPFDALIQVVEGMAEIIINRKSYLLETGDAIIMPADIPHAVKAPEKFKMVLTMIRS